VEYISAMEFNINDPKFSNFASVFARFQFPETQENVFFFLLSSFFLFFLFKNILKFKI